MATAQNVLIIMSDEHQARALGSEGHPHVRTPRLDALAEAGTRFTRCWTPSPICVPARGSFATGRWVHDIGTWHSAQPYDGTVRGWAHDARDAGWRTASIGKLHYSGPRDDHGLQETILPMWVAGGVGWVQGLPRRRPLPYPEAAEMARDAGVGSTTYTRYDERVTDAACRWLGDHAGRDEPWVLFVSFVAPHYPLSVPLEYIERNEGQVPPPDIEHQPITHPAVAAMADWMAYHRYFDEERTEVARRAYYGLVSFLDHNVGRVLDALQASGDADRTRVVYTSDHGEMLGNRGLWGKSYMYEDSVSAPMIVAGPDVPSGATVDTAASLIDVHATVRDVISDRAEDDADDTPSVSLWEQATSGRLDRVAFSEYHDGGSVTGSFAVEHEGWKYVHHVGERPELFRRADDPDEITDLGASGEHATIAADCERVLREVVDPTAADAAAFESQERLLDSYGGVEGIASMVRFDHTPVPE